LSALYEEVRPWPALPASSFPVCRTLLPKGQTGGETVFFGDEDYQAYPDLLKAALVKSGSQVCA